MLRHDRTRAVSKAPPRWPSQRTLQWIVDNHCGLFLQLSEIFGERIACEMVVTATMRGVQP